jgi:hypothetical protein
MAEPKTQPNDASVAKFLAAIPDSRIRADCRRIAAIMRAATRARPQLWGSAIVGFGRCRTTYADGHEAEWPLIAFSPRRQNITLYIMDGFSRYDALLSRLGPHACGKVCLYIKRLSDVHLPTLTRLVRASVRHRRAASVSS